MNLRTESLFSIESLIPIVVLIEGFVSIAIEILTIRQLLPVAGGSVIVTSLIIGIFLLFLALGYRHGGRLQHNLSRILRINFLAAAFWMGIGLSYSFIFLFFNLIQKITGPHILYALLLYLLIIVAPLIFILGQTIPITMNMMKQNKPIGIIGGDTMGLSTLGSFLGATVTALLFMNYFGVGWTVFINFALLVILAILFTDNKAFFFLQLIFSVGITFLVYNLNVAIEKKLFIETNNYANYAINLIPPDQKVLLINNSYSSYINKEKKGFRYIETIKKILFDDLNLRNADILVLGSGGFTLSAEKTAGNHFTYVDIDPEIRKIVSLHFLPDLDKELIAADARYYIRTSKKLFDAIVVDTYSNVMSIPAHLLTKEYMDGIKARLKPEGVAILNIIAKPGFHDRYSRRIDNTIRAAFSNCTATPLDYADHITNILYVCYNQGSSVDNSIYADNLNTATTDSFLW